MTGKFRSTSLVPVLARAVLLLPLMATAAGALDTGAGACLVGRVAENDYSELSQSFRDGLWNMRIGVKLVSESEHVKLAVLDTDNNSVCADAATIAEMAGEDGPLFENAEAAPARNKCIFSANTGDAFVVQIDNRESANNARYSLCPF